jgi:Protein of unknown function (DUF3489)
MTAVQARIPTKAKRSNASFKNGKSKYKEKHPSKLSAAIHAATDGEKHSASVTKHDRILSLLRRGEGATIPDMMEVTDWQQHSVRGFLAGTVKTKLGFKLTSSKTDGELRRYRIGTSSDR